MTERAGSKRLPLVDHLEELRRRLWVCILSISLFSVAGFFLAPHVIKGLKRPAAELLPTLAFFSPTEALMAYVNVGLSLGIAASMPVLLYELWEFVRPGLTSGERSAGIVFVCWGSALFAAGASFAYWGLLPVSLRFLLTFGDGTLQPVISVSRYLSFTLAVLLTCGIVFEFPIAIFGLTRLGVLSPKLLRQKWKTALLGMVIVAALLTPTQDVVTLLLMTLPLLLLYGISLFVSQAAVKQQK